jgi:acyl carrier protein
MTPTTFDRLCEILRRDYPAAADRLRPEATLESLGIDSLGVAELLFNVEDVFAITLPPEPVQLATLGEVADFIDRLRVAQAAPQAPAGGPSPTP